jgi:hypothetical protein
MDHLGALRVEAFETGAATNPEGWDMCTIPVDLERRFERRWAAKFASPVASTAPKSASLKATVTDPPSPQEPTKLLEPLEPLELADPVANLSSGPVCSAAARHGRSPA